MSSSAPPAAAPAPAPAAVAPAAAAASVAAPAPATATAAPALPSTAHVAAAGVPSPAMRPSSSLHRATASSGSRSMLSPSSSSAAAPAVPSSPSSAAGRDRSRPRMAFGSVVSPTQPRTPPVTRGSAPRSRSNSLSHARTVSTPAASAGSNRRRHHTNDDEDGAGTEEFTDDSLHDFSASSPRSARSVASASSAASSSAAPATPTPASAALARVLAFLPARPAVPAATATESSSLTPSRSRHAAATSSSSARQATRSPSVTRIPAASAASTRAISPAPSSSASSIGRGASSSAASRAAAASSTPAAPSPSPHSLALQLRTLQQALASMTAERDALRLERDDLLQTLQERDAAEHAHLLEHLASLEAAQAETLAAEAERQAAATAAQEARADAEHWHAEAEAWRARCEEVEAELQQVQQQQQQQRKASTPRLRSKSPASPSASASVSTAHSAELQRLRSQLAASAPLESELQSHRALVKSLQRQLEDLKREHAASTEAHRTREESLRRTHARAIASLQAEHASTLSTLQADSAASEASLKAQQSQVLTQLRTDHAQAMAMLPSTAAFQALQKQVKEMQSAAQTQEQRVPTSTIASAAPVAPTSPPAAASVSAAASSATLRSFEAALTQSQARVSSLQKALSDSQSSNVALLERVAKHEMHIEILSAHMKDMELAAKQQQQQQQQSAAASLSFGLGSPASKSKLSDPSAGLASPSAMRAAILRVSALEDQLSESQAGLVAAEDRLRAEQATVASLRSLLKASEDRSKAKAVSDSTTEERQRLRQAYQEMELQSERERATCEQLATQLHKQTEAFDKEVSQLQQQLEAKNALAAELLLQLGTAHASAAPPSSSPAAASPSDEKIQAAALEVRSLTLELASTKQLLATAQADATCATNATAAANAAAVAAAASFALESKALRAEIAEALARAKETQEKLDEATAERQRRAAPVEDTQSQSSGNASNVASTASDAASPVAVTSSPAALVAAIAAPESAAPAPPSILLSEHDSVLQSLRDSHAATLARLTQENAALESSLAPLRLCAVQLATMQEEKLSWDRSLSELRAQVDPLRSQVDQLRAEKQQQASISHDRLAAANAEKVWLHQQLEQAQQSMLLRAPLAATQKRVLQQSAHALADLRSCADRTRGEVAALQSACSSDLLQLHSSIAQITEQHRSALVTAQGSHHLESSKLILALNAANLRVQELESVSHSYALHPSALTQSLPAPVRPAQIAWEAETRKAVSEAASLREQLREMAASHAQQLAETRADRAHSNQQDEDETASFQLRLRQMQREKEELIAAHEIAIKHLTAAGTTNAVLAASIAAPGSLAQKLADAQQALAAAHADHQSALQGAAHRLAQTQAGHQEQLKGLHQQLSETEHRLRDQHAAQQLAQAEVAALHEQLSTLAALGNSQANQISHLRRSLTLATEGEDARVSEALAEGRRELRASQESVRVLQAQVDRFSLAFNELRASSDALANEKAQLISAEQTWVAQRDAMAQSHARELDQSRRECHDLRLRHEDLLRELRALRQEFASTAEDRDSASNALESLRQELAAARRDREHSAEQALEHAARVLHLQSALDALRMQLTSTDQLRADHDALMRAAETAEQDRRRLSAQLTEANLLRADLHGTITVTQEKLSAAENELHEKNSTISSLRRELDMLRVQLQQGAQSTATSNVALKASLAAAEKQIEGQQRLIQSLRVELDTLARNSEAESKMRLDAQRALADRDMHRPAVHRSHDAERADTLPLSATPIASRRPGGSAPTPVSPTFEAFFQPDSAAGTHIPAFTLASAATPIAFAPTLVSPSPQKLVSEYYPIHSAALTSPNRSSSASAPMNGSHTAAVVSPSKALPPLPAVPEHSHSPVPPSTADRSYASFSSPPSSSLHRSVAASSYASPASSAAAAASSSFASVSSSTAASSFASAFASANAAFISARSAAAVVGGVQSAGRTSLSPESKHEQAVLDAMGRGY